FIFSDKKQEYYFGGMIQNFSRGGIFFKSDRCLEPGTLIYTMRKNSKNFYEYYRPDIKEFSKQADRRPNRFLGEVRWCRDIININKTSCYAIGIRYFNIANQDKRLL
ncbi:hypothetical protein QUF76_15040, partial [Desulfobacterales bacterium HSG16]|nr:hypothetical protein [Desulfobacterales bacterium HSG16]